MPDSELSPEEEELFEVFDNLDDIEERQIAAGVPPEDRISARSVLGLDDDFDTD